MATSVPGLTLILLGLGAVVAMLLAPRARPGVVRVAAALSLAAALVAAVLRFHASVVPGNMLVDDGMNRLGQALVCLTALGALAFLRPGAAAREAPALLLLAALGAVLLCGAVHAATLFLGLELVTLSLVAMFVLPMSRPALEAGYKLLILGGIGAATLLLAVALSYAATGVLSLDAWSGRGPLVSLGTALLLAGLAFKLALVPFHMWTPDAFSGAPAAAAAFAGTGSKIGVTILLLRLDAAGPPEPLWSVGLALLAGASILLGNLQALRQTSVTRMLGYSSIAHSGYIIAIVAAGSALVPEAALFYLSGYALALIAAMCAAADTGRDSHLGELRGLVWSRPLVGGALAVSLLSLAGLPASVGFFGKFYLFTALISREAWGLLIVAAVGSALGLYFYARFAAAVFRQGPDWPPHELCWTDAAVLLLCSLIILGTGLFPTSLLDLVRMSVNPG